MSENLTIAKELLLAPASLDENNLQSVLVNILGNQIDYADLYFQNTYYENWSLEDSQIKGGSFNIERGVGVRAVSGEKTGFAYSDDILLPELEQAAMAARSIAKRGQEKTISIATPPHYPQLYPSNNPLDSIDKQSKMDLLLSIDTEARSLDPRVSQVNASLSGSFEVVMILNSEGKLCADVRPLVSVHVSVIVEDNGKRESARSGGGGRCDYNFFLQKSQGLVYAREAVREALINLDAIEAPAGTMPVVLGPGWPGVLLHEAVGHGLEGDFNRKGLSAFSGRIGERVASKGVTVVDDGTISGRRGSLSIDDEGTISECTTLIDDGYLKGYMQDSLNARLMGVKSTANCRRESYAHIPIPRMTNTYMLNGDYAPDEIIKTVEKGLYAVNFGGGQVDITSGKFVFSASEAYLIENGKIGPAVKGATLIGNGPEVMQKISMIGNDMTLDPGIGVCGKDGQSVPVGVGQPTLKIDALTVGGTETS